MADGDSPKLLIVFPGDLVDVSRDVATTVFRRGSQPAVLNVARPTEDLQPRDHLPRAFFDAPALGPVGAVLETRPVDGTSAGFRRIVDIAGAEGGRLAGYGVEEAILLDHAKAWADGEPTPGLKMISMGRRNSTLSIEDVARHWREVHGPLALRHHVGMWRYVQNLVVERMGTAHDGIDLIAELSFPSVESFVHRFFDSREGRRAIAADAAYFAGGGDTHFFIETVLPGPAGSGSDTGRPPGVTA